LGSWWKVAFVASIEVLGPLSVDGDAGVLPPRERAVLAALVVHRGDVVSAETLADAWWRERPPPTWHKAIQGCILQLRKVLGAAAIETRSRGYRLVVPPNDIDACRFVGQLTRAQELLSLGEPDRAAHVTGDALELWHGRALIDVESWEPGRVEARRLEELRLDAEELWIDVALRCGRHREVLAEAQARVAEHPSREHRWTLLALAQYQAGRQGDALQTLRCAREMLVRELGIDPGSEIVTLEQAILRQDPALVAAQLPQPSAACPYPGLLPYDLDDADGFFGRDGDVVECLRRLGEQGVLAVVGPSGGGKSSLVRAGVAAALARGGRRVVIVTPDSDLDDALGTAVARGVAPVLVVDQCEEAVAFDRDPAAAARFFAALAAHAERGDLVVALRADRLGDLAAHPAFARVVERGLYLLRGMDERDLRAAIEGPARQAGLLLEPGLVDLLVRDVEGEPGALPLLSHALRQSWHQREGRTLTVASYQASGGIRGSVAQSAEQIYEQAADLQRPILRDLMLRLVIPNPEGEPVRSRVPRRLLSTDADHERLIERLVSARLVTADEDVVELAHEAIARAWPRLRGWLDDDSEGQRVWRHLAVASSGWEAMGQPDSELYRGARLAQALEWRERRPDALNASERAFLDASQWNADRERSAARRRRRLLTTGLLVGVVVALVLGGAAVIQARHAATESERAGAAEHDARLEALVNRSLALRPTDRAVAALLAVEAHRQAPGDYRALSALLGTFTAAAGFQGYVHLPPDSSPIAGTVLPDGSNAVIAIRGGDLHLLNLRSGELGPGFTPRGADLLEPTAATQGSSIVRVSGDGRFVAQLVPVRATHPCLEPDSPPDTDDAGCAALLVYDVATGQPVLGPVTPPVGLGDLAISADGSLVAVAGGHDGRVAVYRTSDAQVAGDFPGVPRPAGVTDTPDAAAIAFGADDRLYAGSIAGAVRVIDPNAMAVVGTIQAPPMATNVNLVATRDGLVGSGTDMLVALDTSTGATRWSATIVEPGDPSPCVFLAVTDALGKAYCGNQFGVLAERDLATGRPTGVRLDAQVGSVGDLAITADGTELIGFGRDEPVVARWRLDGQVLIGTAGKRGLLAESYDPSGQLLMAVGSGEQLDAALWDPATGDVVDELDGISRVPLWEAPNLLGAAFADGTIGSYDIRGHVRVDLPDPAAQALDPPANAWVSASGTRVFLSYLKGDGPNPGCVVRTFDLEAGRLTGPAIQFDDCVWVESVSAAADMSRVAVTYTGQTGSPTVVLDGTTGNRIGPPLSGFSSSIIAPNGTLVGAGFTGEVIQYDLRTLAPIGTFPGARGRIDQLMFSADGSLLMVGSRNQLLSIYDVATRTRLGDPIGTDGPFDGPKGALRPDGRAVAVNHGDEFTIWDLDPDHLAAAACRLAGRNLTPTEWQTYLGHPEEYRATCPEFA
jgi:DNA-binding SARP family transcriptional activator/WD40 repeat protein